MSVETQAFNGHMVGELRCHAETARLLIDPIWRGAGVPHGHGEAVVLVPGLLTGDRSMQLLSSWLRRIGYRTYRAGMLLNIDCSARMLQALEHRVEQVKNRTGRPVAIVGHSRGGILARAVATRRPDLVERVVTLGSGLDNGYDINVLLRGVVKGLRRYHVLTTDRVSKHGCMTQDCACAFGQASRAPFPESVDLVSIYTRTDGFANWRSCRVPYARNCEVPGSHLGLVANRDAYRVVALALSDSLDEMDA
jgi:pimeloyl-ACP methyl ester carboxylesterase